MLVALCGLPLHCVSDHILYHAWEKIKWFPRLAAQRTEHSPAVQAPAPGIKKRRSKVDFAPTWCRWRYRTCGVPKKKPNRSPAERVRFGKDCARRRVSGRNRRAAAALGAEMEQGSGRMAFIFAKSKKERRSKADFAPTWCA